MSTIWHGYRGRRNGVGTAIVVRVESDREPPPRTLEYREDSLPLRLDLFNHSPTGFEWGYFGSGPAQLALALAADALGDDARALRVHQRFKERLVAGWRREATWSVSRDALIKVIEACERELVSASANP